MSDMQTVLTDFVKQELAIGRSQPIRPEDDLLSTGVIDSLGLMQLVLFIDEKLGIKIPDEDVVIDNFKSIAALTGYLEGKKTTS
jgi:acyl carrier protein